MGCAIKLCRVNLKYPSLLRKDLNLKMNPSLSVVTYEIT